MKLKKAFISPRVAAIAKSPIVRSYAKKALKTLPGLLPGIKPHHMQLGMEIVHHLTRSGGMAAKEMPMKLHDEVIDSLATGGITESHYRTTHKGSRTLKIVEGISTRGEFITRTAYRLQSAIGTQAIGSMATGGALAPVVANSAVASAIYPGSYYVSGATATLVQGLNNFCTAVANQQAVSVQSNTSKIFHKYCELETEIASLSTYPIYVDIYELVARHDLSSGNGGLTNLQIYAPNNYWSGGLANSVATPAAVFAGASGVTATTIGSNPYDSELFNVYWKIAAKFTVALSAGDVHRHKSNYTINRIIDPQRGGYSSLLAGLTRNIMVVVRGTPVRDTVTANSVNAGTATVSVDHVMTYKFDANVFTGKNTAVLDPMPVVAIGETIGTNSAVTNTTLNPI